MPELIILELLAGLFLLLPAIRMPSKGRYSLDGLVCLPPLALLIVIGIFPAYGFRPECLPLLAYCVINNAANIAPLAAMLTRVHAPVSRRPRWRVVFFIALTVGVAVFFVPRTETRFLAEAEGVRSFTLEDAARKHAITVRVYGAENGPEKPLLLFAPPVSASIAAVDLLCGSLRDAGFTVLAWSRPGFDLVAAGETGKKRLAPPRQIAAIFRALVWGRRYAGSNEAGRKLEAGRRTEVEFLLDYLRENEVHPGVNSRPGAATPETAGRDTGAPVIFAAGLGAGGAALLDLARDAEAAARFPALRGVIAFESPPLWAFSPPPVEADEPAIPPKQSVPAALWTRFTGRLRALVPRRIVNAKTIPRAVLPVCMVAGGRIRSAAGAEGRYAALIRYFHAGAAPAALVSVDGMGVMDYSDVAEKYPILTFPFREEASPAWSGMAAARNTAALAARFAARVLAASGAEALPAADAPVLPPAGSGEADGDAPQSVTGTPGIPDAASPAVLPLASRGIMIETNGVWNSRGWGDILTP
ncbi:MAG: hypothetical protein LBC88_03115 [Spirochaetaceae bacterium]|jgi:hypothetical protein|nr:hypothetical protein [Spirochaetaceae bacterium]